MGVLMIFALHLMAIAMDAEICMCEFELLVEPKQKIEAPPVWIGTIMRCF
jgi:hypothetical protein